MRTTSPRPDATAPLARIWPAALAEPGAAEAYAGALSDLDPAAVDRAVAALGARGRAAPPPAILRTVVLSWQQAAATGLATDPAPLAVATPAVGARVRALAPMLAVGLLLAGASGLTRGPWMRIANADRAVTLAGGEVSGGGIVAGAGPIAMLVALVGAFLVWHGRPAAQIRGLLGVLAIVSVGAVYGAMTGLMRVSEIANRLDFDAGTAEGGVPSDVAHVVSVSTGPALATTLALVLASVAVSAGGLVALRRA